MAEQGKQFAVTDPGRVGLGRHFRFEAGHVLEGYDGKCSTPHGHSYNGWVLVSVPLAHADSCGIVLDFDVLKQAIHECIFRPYDHRTLQDTAEKLVQQCGRGMQAWFKLWAGRELDINHEDLGLKTRRVPQDVTVELVRLYETANCFAEYKREGF